MFTTPVPSLHRFDAYRLALEFRRHVVRWLPLRRAELSDQLDRASISVPLNIAEGAGRSTPVSVRGITQLRAGPRSSAWPVLISLSSSLPLRPPPKPAWFSFACSTSSPRSSDGDSGSLPAPVIELTRKKAQDT